MSIGTRNAVARVAFAVGGDGGDAAIDPGLSWQTAALNTQPESGENRVNGGFTGGRCGESGRLRPELVPVGRRL